jgi:hypothetical protein
MMEGDVDREGRRVARSESGDVTRTRRMHSKEQIGDRWKSRMEALPSLPSLRLYFLRCRHSPYPFGLHFQQISRYSVTAEPEPEPDSTGSTRPTRFGRHTLSDQRISFAFSQ